MKAFLAIVIGLAVTTIEVAVMNVTNVEWLFWILLFPWALLMALVPHPNIGSPEHPFYEGTPLDLTAAAVGLPISALVNIGVVYLMVRRLWKSKR